MISFNDVTKTFLLGRTRRIILSQASLNVNQGESVGLLMPPQSGKTTVINMVAGLEKPDEGTIRRSCRVSFPLGFMSGVVPAHTVRENCRFIARLYGVDPDYMEAFVEWINSGEIDLGANLGALSKDARNRVNLALAFGIDFDVFLIDEGIPRIHSESFNRKMAEIMRGKRESTTIFMVSNDSRILQRYVGKVYSVDCGEIREFDGEVMSPCC